MVGQVDEKSRTVLIKDSGWWVGIRDTQKERARLGERMGFRKQCASCNSRSGLKREEPMNALCCFFHNDYLTNGT